MKIAPALAVPDPRGLALTMTCESFGPTSASPWTARRPRPIPSLTPDPLTIEKSAVIKAGVFDGGRLQGPSARRGSWPIWRSGEPPQLQVRLQAPL